MNPFTGIVFLGFNNSILQRSTASNSMVNSPSFAQIENEPLIPLRSAPSLLEMGIYDTHYLEEMGLPSFQSTYLFLLRVPLDVIHECLKLRLEQRPETEPSLLSVRQVLQEHLCTCILLKFANVM